MFPRYFVARTDPVPVGALHPVSAEIVDAFRWRDRDVAVVRDLRGDLHLAHEEALPSGLRAAARRHELAIGGLRTLAADEIWLLDVHSLEQLPDTPGTNDPIYLDGRLSGPWPGAPAIAGGALAVTRADLLAGLASEAPFAVRSAGGRTLHAALPAARAEDLAVGLGYVLAFPLVPLELQPDDPANEAVAAQLIHDVLGALRSDLQRARADHWLVKERIPVPSRAVLEQRLVGDGWEIRGESAVRPAGPPRSFTGFLDLALGIDWDRKILLPPEAPLDVFLALARRALASFPGFPDERADATSRRVAAPGRASAAVGVPGPTGLTGAIALPPRPAGERDEWEANFRRSPTSPGLGTLVTKIR